MNKYVNDLIKQNGDFYTQVDFTMKTGIKTNFHQYNGLIKATKQYLKQFKMIVTNKQMNPFIPSNIQLILRHCKESKTMYEILNKTIDIPTEQATWNKTYDITEGEWKAIHTVPFRVTSYPALQWFQISINHNILVTNKLLQQMIKFPFKRKAFQVYEGGCCRQVSTVVSLVVW